MAADIVIKVMPWCSCPLPRRADRWSLSLSSCPVALAAAAQKVMRGRESWLGGTQMVLGAARMLTACRCPLAAAAAAVQQVQRGRGDWLGGPRDYGIVVADR